MQPKDRPNPGDPGPEIPDPDETRPRDPREVPVIAPVEHDTHGTPFKRVDGPGPDDEGKGAAGEDALKRLDRRET
jgi:hypothetical protein